MLFENLQLIEPILKALKSEGYTTPTPIQQQAIPIVLDKKDLLGVAQTGTGKTAAFAIPIIQLLCQDKNITAGKREVRCLILTPTRELAIQIGESFDSYGRHTPLRNKVIFGGVNQHSQVEALKYGLDILIATPGRLLDLMNQKLVNLNHIQFFVLDEADRMLDMGFVHDVKKIIAKLPSKRQSLFFSATMPSDIIELSKSILSNPQKVEVTPASTTVEMINQVVYYIDKGNKKNLLMDILKDQSIERALVFTRTKHGANKVAEGLSKSGIRSEAIHGNKSQNARQNALNNFKSKQTRVLVATDIAARGIDIDELTHVINYELPNVPESYVHRIGRTGRAGASGIAIAFCDAEEKPFLKDIQKLIGKHIEVVENHAYPLMNHQVEDTISFGRQRNFGNKSSFQKNERRSFSSNNDLPKRTGGTIKFQHKTAR
jgi:ATP-dependent RNA helicase RhlE